MLKELVSRNQYNAFFCDSMNDLLQFIDIATMEMKFANMFSYFRLDENLLYGNKVTYVSPMGYGTFDESYVLIIHGIYKNGLYYIDNDNDNDYSFLLIPADREESYIDSDFKVFNVSLILRKKKLEKISLSQKQLVSL